jgi:ubiquinone/menaquinone biosynthesis C-methylase UbiE
MTDANNYNQYAARRQEALKKGQSLLHRFVEKPAMKKLIPSLDTKQVLMLGCGTGEESMLLEEFGAVGMTGIDSSSESIRLANESYPTHTFVVGDMHQLPFDDASFIYSSLTIHYSSNPIGVYKEAMRVLKPDGIFQFSIGHPMRWASEKITLNDRPTKLLGYTEDDTPRLYGDYSGFNEYEETFPSGETLRFWIGPPSMHFKLLRDSGFIIDSFVETKAIEETKDTDKSYYERFSHFPQFTIFTARKPE